MERLLEVVGLGPLVLLALVFVPLERLLPLHPRRTLRPGLADDLVYWFLNRLLVGFGIVGVLALASAGVAPLVPARVTAAVGALPLAVQVPLAILSMDLGFYAVHRAFHRVPWLWQFHAVHHSIVYLDWIAGIRVHAVDQVLTKGLSVVPLVLLGFDDAATGWAALVYFWQSHFVHANLRVRLGPLRWIVAGPEFHHWHHSVEVQDRNFAGQLPFLDRIFGTAHLPVDRVPTAYGVAEPVPAGFVDQFFYPLRRIAGRLPGMVPPRRP